MLEPISLSLKLAPGQGVTETKLVSIPLPEKMDVLFSYDLTGSMSGIISTAKTKTAELITKLETLGIDINYGVVSYMDYPHSYDSYGYSATYGDAAFGDYAYRLDQPVTSDTTAVLNAINSLVLGYGGDTPQDYTRPFFESYSDPNIAWRDGARRMMLNFADAVPHDDNLNEGVPGKTGTNSTGGDPGRDEIMFTPDDLDLQTVLADMATNKITLIEAHASTSDIDYWNYWTGITGGQTFIINSATFVDDVFNGITSTLSSVTGLHLVAAPGFENWIESVTPDSFTGLATDPVEFTLRLRVPPDTADGLYNFTISAVDAAGIIHGVQSVEIDVITVKSAGGIDVEYIQVYRIDDEDHDCDRHHEDEYYVYPVRFVIGCPGACGVLAEGIYHTLINIQNNTTRDTSVKIKVSIPPTSGNAPVVTKGVAFDIDPFKALQISGSKINTLLASTPYYNAPFLSGTVLILSKKDNLGVSATYTFYQTNFIV